jgi:hypothetical protein
MQFDPDVLLIPLHRAQLEFDKMGNQHRFRLMGDFHHANNPSDVGPKAVAIHLAFLRR